MIKLMFRRGPSETVGHQENGHAEYTHHRFSVCHHRLLVDASEGARVVPARLLSWRGLRRS